jgi:hypothetical protein
MTKKTKSLMELHQKIKYVISEHSKKNPLTLVELIGVLETLKLKFNEDHNQQTKDK